MGLAEWLTNWYQGRKEKSEADTRLYEEEVNGEARQLISETIAEFKREQAQIHFLLESDLYRHGLESVGTMHEDNPWLTNEYRSERSRAAHEAYEYVRANQKHLVDRAGAWWVNQFFKQHRAVCTSLDKLTVAEDRRTRKE